MNCDAPNRIFPVHVVHHHEFGTDRELIFPGPGWYDSPVASSIGRHMLGGNYNTFEIVWSAD